MELFYFQILGCYSGEKLFCDALWEDHLKNMEQKMVS